MIRIADTEPRFETGQLVRHRRYGYRGVIVAVDSHCLADQQWYESNQTQPDRQQAWYHVLVDGSGSITYAAQVNLELDWSPDPIDHPLLTTFFSGMCDGKYVRNSQQWPGWK